MEFVITICDRGVVFGRTMQAILDNVRTAFPAWDDASLGREYDIVWSHDKPIPEAQNWVIERALTLDPFYIWMVEEDVVPPMTTLERMMDLAEEEKADAVTAWYKLEGGSPSVYQPNGRFICGGLGCLLIQADAFTKIPRPWFSINYSYTSIEGALIPNGGEEAVYGRQDVHFFAQMANAGLKTTFLDVECEHLYVAEYGKPKVNNGCHLIKSR